MKTFLKSLINYDFWRNYNNEKKLKDALFIFFGEEDKDLQKLFLKNFTYPSDMTNPPVRYNPDTGEIYYTINFNSKELFYNEATLQTAFAQSLSILSQNLPLGVTEYLTPEIAGRVEDSFSILVVVSPTYEFLDKKSMLKALIKPAGIFVGLITLITLILSYV